jgi:hypothetical protein
VLRRDLANGVVHFSLLSHDDHLHLNDLNAA